MTIGNQAATRFAYVFEVGYIKVDCEILVATGAIVISGAGKAFG